MDFSNISDEQLKAAVSSPPKSSSIVGNAVKDLRQVLLPVELGEALGQAVENYGQTKSVVAPEEGFKQGVVEPVKAVASGVKQSIHDLVTDPAGELQRAPISTALMVAPFAGGIRSILTKGLARGAEKAVIRGGERALIDTAEALPLKLEKTNIQNIAGNKYVTDTLSEAGTYIGKQAPEIAKEAADMTKKVKPAIREARHNFYQELGIEDTDVFDSKAVSKAVDGMQKEIDHAKRIHAEADVKKAQYILDDLKSGETVNFGKVKLAADDFFDLAEDSVNAMGNQTSLGRFYKKMGSILSDLKKTDPRIAAAGAKYADLINAEKLINKTTRLNREMGEMRLENRILSSYKDKGQMTFKDNLNKIEETLKKYPETAPLVDYGGFTDKIKLAQIANDIATKKEVLPTGMGRIPGVKYIGNLLRVGNPEFHAQMLARGVKSGKISKAGVLGKTRISPNPIYGPAVTTGRAIRDILGGSGQGRFPTTPISIQALIANSRKE